METNHGGITPTSYATGFQNPRGFAKLKRIAAAVFAALVVGNLHAELIPAARLNDWTPGVKVGVPGGIPTNRTALIDVSLPPYNADRTGATNAAPAIQAAIDAAVAGQVVYLRAGTYRLDASLNFGGSRDNITLRGESRDTTILDCRANPGIFVGTSAGYQWAWPASGNIVTGVRTQGTTTLSISDTSAFSVGQIVHIKVTNQQNEAAIQAGAAPVVSVGTSDNVRSMKAKVTAKTANSLTISHGLYFDGTGLTVTVNATMAQTDYVGIENMTLECMNANVIFGLQFEQAYGSWIKNVKVNNTSNYAFFFYDALNCELRESFANDRRTAGSNGAGVLVNSSSACLIEDNIVYKFFPLVEVNFGSSGNVFAYNFLEDSSVYGALGAGLDTNHGPHNSHNLYEGNITPNVQSDGYFGSASDDTIFRNWIHGTTYTGSLSGFIISLNRFTRNYSLVGNILGTQNTPNSSPYTFGNPNMGNTYSSGTAKPSQGSFWASWAVMKAAATGQGPGSGGFQEKDLDVQATTLLKANYHYGAKTIPANEALGGDPLPASLYRSAKPDWFGNLAWPPFDPANPNPSFTSIPAGQRFANGGTPPVQPPPTVVAPAITLQPQSQTRAAGETATFLASASGSPTPTLQWYKDGIAISGATSATLTIANVQSANAGGYMVIATNSAGSASSSTASLTIGAGATTSAPVFTLQPTSRSAAPMSSTTFTAAATGTPAPTYQWRINGTNLPGATQASLTLSTLTVNDNATYTVVATNSAGSVTSDPATLTVTSATSAPVFTLQPTSRTATAGSSTTFTAAASGTPAPTYQWRINGTNLPGATQASLTLSALTVNDNATYTVVATNSAGSVTSAAATLTVTAATSAPVFTLQPTSRSAAAGSSTTFTAAASGIPAPTYQWRINGTNLPGATQASLTLSTLTVNDNATYTVVATNSAGSVTSAPATLTVIAATSAPVFTLQPTSRTATAGSSTTFTAAATGTPAPTYQWRINGTNLPGATQASLTLSTLTVNDNATYTVVATNSAGSVTSAAATLTVVPATSAPVFTLQPTSRSVTAGSSTTFTAAASGYPAPTYQWRINGTNLPGATQASLTLSALTVNDSATYTVVATNSAGNVTSAAATLTVTPATSAPVFTLQPTSRTATAMTSTTFTAAASGYPAPTYQWRINGTNLPGATQASLTLSTLTVNDNATYTVVATNSAGSVTSTPATLTVTPAQKSPTFTTQPTSRTITVGTSTTFTAAADGTPAPSYQWRKDGTNIAGATSASYTIANPALTDAAIYTVVATNSKGSATSNGAVLAVNPAPAAPVFTTQPASATIATGTAVTFTAAASGYPMPTYQWRKNGVDIAGATSGSHTIASAAAGDAATYVVVATNSAGSVACNGATLTVNSGPTIAARADFNTDGRSDIFWQNTETGEASIWLMNGLTHVSDANLTASLSDWKIVGHGDFNQDGKTDLLWENQTRGEYGVVFMNGCTMGTSVTLGSAASGRPIGAGDFNGDGKVDILWQNKTTGAVTICLMTGTTVTGTADQGIVAADWQVAGVGDFNGDGKADILWINADGRTHGAWLMNGTMRTGWADFGNARTGMAIAGTGDFNGDGKVDILWQNKTTGLREVALMSGSTVSSVVSLGYVDVSWQIRN